MEIAHPEATTSALDALFDQTGLIDMTPDNQGTPVSSTSSVKAATVTDVAQSTSLTAAIVNNTIAPMAPLTPARRAETTAKHVGDVLESLDFAAVRLEGAMYRIGYLESQVDTLQDQLKVLPEFRARAAKAILTERENKFLLETIAEYEAELKETHDLMEKLNQSKTWQFFRWAFGINL